MTHILHCKYGLKLNPLALKCMPNLLNVLDWAEFLTTKTKFELESNPTIFVKKKLWMKEKWLAEVVIIQNVEFLHAAPLEVNAYKIHI